MAVVVNICLISFLIITPHTLEQIPGEYHAVQPGQQETLRQHKPLPCLVNGAWNNFCIQLVIRDITKMIPIIHHIIRPIIGISWKSIYWYLALLLTDTHPRPNRKKIMYFQFFLISRLTKTESFSKGWTVCREPSGHMLFFHLKSHYIKLFKVGVADCALSKWIALFHLSKYTRGLVY